MSPYLRNDDVIHSMSIAIAWISDLSDDLLIRRELICAGFSDEDIHQHAPAAIASAKAKRTLMSGLNQITLEPSNEDQ